MKDRTGETWIDDSDRTVFVVVGPPEDMGPWHHHPVRYLDGMGEGFNEGHVAEGDITWEFCPTMRRMP